MEPGSDKHSVYTHFPKDPNCDICLKTKLQGLLAEDVLVQSCPERNIFGDPTTADHIILSKESESRNNHRHAVVVQDLATQWIQSYTCKQKLSRDPEEPNEVPGADKSFTLTIPLNLAKPLKIFPGIIVRQHHTDQKHMGLLKEQSAEQKKAPLPYCCNQVWMKIGGQILWNAFPICETFRIS